MTHVMPEPSFRSFQWRLSDFAVRRLGVRRRRNAVLCLSAIILSVFVTALSRTAVWEQQNTLVLYSVYFAGLWILIGPLAVVAWEESLTVWHTNMSRLLAASNISQDHLAALIRRRRPLHYFFSTSYALLSALLFVLSYEQINLFVNIDNWPVLYWLTLGILLYIGYVTGAGVAGVIWAALVHRRISLLGPKWEPFHEDGRGGYGFIVDFLIKTAALFSLGTILIPASVSISIRIGGGASLILYLFVFVYCILILMSFVLPISSVMAMARRVRRDYLARVGHRIDKLASYVIFDSEHDSLSVDYDNTMRSGRVQSIGALTSYYDSVASRSMSLIPIPTVLRLIVAVGLPLAGAALQLFIEDLLRAPGN